MKKLLLIGCAIAALSLSACGSDSDTVITPLPLAAEASATPSAPDLKINISPEWTGFYSSWWEIPQYYNGVPKYSGAFGTYTNKHIPVAVWADGSLFHVRTDNTEDGNFRVYAMKDNTEEVLVHTISNWNDPHTNAAINVLPDGYVKVHIASRGLAHKFQSGKIYKSRTPYSLDLECVDGCDDVNYEAYPQVHNAPWGEQLNYTHYLYEDGDTRASRTLWSRNQFGTQQLVKGGHYSVSVFNGEHQYLVYTQLVNKQPDTRKHIYLMKTKNGTDWTTLQRAPLPLPLATDAYAPILYDSGNNFVYLKDVMVDSAGRLHILFIESTSADPTQGARTLREYVYSRGVSDVATVNHNYGGGSYHYDANGGEYIMFTSNGEEAYAGGALSLYKITGAGYELQSSTDGDLNFNYNRKVRGNGMLSVTSMASSSIATRGQHYVVELKTTE